MTLSDEEKKEIITDRLHQLERQLFEWELNKAAGLATSTEANPRIISITNAIIAHQAELDKIK